MSTLTPGVSRDPVGLVDRLSACFSDERAASRVVHEVATLVGKLGRKAGEGNRYEDK